MKRLIISALICLIFFSCKKKKIHERFSEKQLVFVNYLKDQTLKFIDTTLLVQTLEQKHYRKEFREQIGFYGKTFKEEYEVSYIPLNAGNLDLYISVNAGPSPSLNLKFASYQTYTIPDSLHPAFPALILNGKQYTEVYTLRMYKNGQFINNNDTATLFHNKQFGVIQLMFPNGKTIVRTD